jgi:hypothetical protein
MTKVLPLLAVLLAFGLQPAAAQNPMKFFVPSQAGPDATGPDGIEDADEFCGDLGYAAGYGDFEWRAFLDVPAAAGKPAQKATERVGEGPWYNFEGVFIAENPQKLAGVAGEDHNLNRQTALDEKGFQPYSRADSPSPADVLKSGKPDPNGIYFCFAH